MAEQSATSLSDKFDRLTIRSYHLALLEMADSHTTFHSFPNLPTEIQIMIWKESLPRQDEHRTFTLAESKGNPSSLCLSSDTVNTEYPPISMVCRTARSSAISHLPIALPSVTGHPIRIHPRTFVSLIIGDTAIYSDWKMMKRSFISCNIPSFMANIHCLNFHLWSFRCLKLDLVVWRRIIEACPNLTAIVAVRPIPESLYECREHQKYFPLFLDLQRITKRFGATKPNFWFSDSSIMFKIDGIGNDGMNTTTKAIELIENQMHSDTLRFQGI